MAGRQRAARDWIDGNWREIGAKTSSTNHGEGKTTGSCFDGREAAPAATVAMLLAFSGGELISWRFTSMMKVGALLSLEASVARQPLPGLQCRQDQFHSIIRRSVQPVR
jgi:hypothetical protein